MKRLVNILITTIWIGLVGRALWVTSHKTLSQAQQYRNPSAPPPLSQLPVPVVRILSLGHHGLIHDYFHIWMLQKLSDKTELSGMNPDDLIRTIQTVARHELKIESFYLLSCIVMYDDLARPDRCQSLILYGLQAFPDSWRLPMLQGFVFNFRMQQPAEAAAFYALAASRKESPPYVKDLAKKLINKEAVAPDDVSRAFDMMLNVPGGQSRFRDLLNERAAKGAQP